jgi:cobalt-zinc-cadmium efflux system outer membrane protein
MGKIRRASTSARWVAAAIGLMVAPHLYTQEWTEARVVETFLSQSPYAREANARVAIARAEARGRTFYANPSVNFSRESAGLTEFYQAEQTLPLSGRLRYLRQAGDASVRATEADGAAGLWQARSALRRAFYRVAAAQEREAIYAASAGELDKVLRILRDREREGEGSKFDRLRAEREKAELLAEMALARAETALERGQMLAFLPAGTEISRVAGRVETTLPAPVEAELYRRALAVREDYRAEARRAEQFGWERRAAERLRIPEPTVSAGLKRADLGAGGPMPRNMAMGPVVGITLPLPLVNKGQAEVARYAGEQERVAARMQALARQIQAAVEANAEALRIRMRVREEFAKELAGTGPELIRIATVAYQEGEIGILQLLDAYRADRGAQLKLLEIQAAVREAQIELERVVGEELEK